MRKKFTVVLALMLVFTMAFGTVTVQAKTKDEIKKELNTEKDKLQDGKKKEAELSKKIQDMEKQIGDLENEVYAMEEKIGETEAQIAATETELAEAEAKVAEQNKNLNSRLRSMYKNGSIGFVDVILSSGSISEFISNVEMVKIVYSSDQEVLEQLQTSYEEIDAKKQELETLQEEMVAQKQTHMDKQAQLEADQAAVAKEKEGVNKANGEIEDNIAALERESGVIDSAIKNDTSASAGSTYTEGVFAWPVPANRTINSPYGPRICPYHGSEIHSGIDIDATHGDRVVAAASGHVITATYNKSYGYYIVISHGSKLYTLYAHNSSLTVKAGTYVTKGQQIARAGSTGDSTGDHLHFEVRKGGNSRSNHTNPNNYLY